MADLGITRPQSAVTTKVAAALRATINPTTLVAFVLVAMLLFLVANPLFQLVTYSFTKASDHSFTFANYVTAFGRPRYVQALINSLELGAAAALFASLIAVPLAWGVARTDMPGRAFVHAVVLASFLIPPFVGAIGWILLGGPNAGWINKAWMAVTGASHGPFNIFTFWGLALVTALYSFPLIYVFAKSALELISTEMEEAAAILGAGPMRATLRVTLPLALPAILGSVFLVFLEVLGLYGTPALIAIPAGFNVVTTQLAAFFENPIRVEVAAAFSMPMVGITIVLLWVQRRLLARKSYVTVGGKGGHRAPMALGPYRWILFAYAMLIAGFTVFMPLCIILQTSFSKAWALPMSVTNFTLRNFQQVMFEQATVRQALFNTFEYAIVTATICTLLGFAVAYISQRKLLPYSQLLANITLAPFAVPGIVLAICFYAAYAPPPFALYGLGALVVVAFVTRFLPIAFTNSNSAIQGLHPELEEAVRIAGGNQANALRLVVLPILKKSLFGSWLLIFIVATRELSTAIFLSGPQTRVVSVLTLELSEQGQYEMLSAIAVLLLVVTGVLTLLGATVLGRDFMLRRN
ncbi:iron ABC transporter permease [Bradyrhizobium sp. CCGUVB1N3]|uniref:ABC transporter permease n=1 Tax=Bradyrhizobium sp. CCGUVB1N3 TaxID=2949629 RepID=UPI0020B2C4CA|nr:iron ABC transporter permease [Bradyrhizobium sp. CCGUVB1N3]MCP3476766.1 iron ABC transporter permease [Bradyrhizobium sp. CCGUVB1N3]